MTGSAVVTGGASGMGEAISRRFGLLGRPVAVWDVDAGRAEAVAAAIRHGGGSARAYAVDVSSIEAVARATAAVEEELGTPGALACCAGISHRTPVLETSDEQWRRVVAVDLDGVFWCFREIGARMAKAGGGAMVAISSTAGLTGMGDRPAYVAAKHGVVGLTKAAAVDLALHGIRVNAIAPGPIDTPLLRVLNKAPGAIAEFSVRTPLGRMGSVEEIADLAVYLLSDQASYVTGQVIACDGGLMANGWPKALS
jgi:2-hydroxycyclohexanecarboxyl-CoA dehydrogenase